MSTLLDPGEYQTLGVIVCDMFVSADIIAAVLQNELTNAELKAVFRFCSLVIIAEMERQGGAPEEARVFAAELRSLLREN